MQDRVQIGVPFVSCVVMPLILLQRDSAFEACARIYIRASRKPPRARATPWSTDSLICDNIFYRFPSNEMRAERASETRNAEEEPKRSRRTIPRADGRGTSAKYRSHSLMRRAKRSANGEVKIPVSRELSPTEINPFA